MVATTAAVEMMIRKAGFFFVSFSAINFLKNAGPGTFVIRDSQSFPGAFGLAVKVMVPPAHAIKKDMSKWSGNQSPTRKKKYFLYNRRGTKYNLRNHAISLDRRLRGNYLTSLQLVSVRRHYHVNSVGSGVHQWSYPGQPTDTNFTVLSSLLTTPPVLLLNTSWINKPFDWLTDWSIDWLIDRSIDRSIDWLIDWSIDWLIDCLIDWLFDWLIDWLIDRFVDWLIDWLIDWSIRWLIDRSIDWLID